jgi:two-component system nitrogen regulation sensor histidine kinase NtrY
MANDDLHRRGPGGSKGILFLIVLVLLTAAAIAVHLRLRGFDGPLSDYILILILVIANFLLLSAVMVMTARSLWKLSIERKSGVLGAKYRTKLVTAFVSLSIIPTILLFLIASGMFTRSIERLFSLRLENSLKDSISVTQEYYTRLRERAVFFGRQLAKQFSEERLLERSDQPGIEEHLRRKAEEYGLGAVELYGAADDRTVTIVTRMFPRKTFSPSPQELVVRALSGEEVSAVTSAGKQGDIVRGLVPLARTGETKETVAAVSVSLYVSQSLTEKMGGIRSAYVEYRSALKSKEPIKLAYVLGFLSVTLSLLLAAIWVALRVSAGITVPIRKLAEGTVEVAQGNLDFRVDVKSGDEVGMLVESFNRMTADLKGSRERIRQEGEYKDTILANIDAGVISLDRTGKITTVNPAAARILGTAPRDVLNRRYDEAFGFIDLAPVRDLFRRLEEGHGRAEDEVSLAVRGRTLVLRMRVSTLRDAAGSLIGSVITFDDLTELLRAQKAATWQDVARQIAHEVKNPLTPIKLSAERLRKKFSEGAPDFGAVFDESSRTIIQEVNGLEGLLNEFSEFARMPRPNPAAGRLAPVVEGALQLFAAAHRNVRFIMDIPPDLPDVLIDQEQVKRVFINLFKNAVEVMSGEGAVRVSARALPENGTVCIEVADDGPGIPDGDLSRLFEPYFSRKKKGGGLGLAIVERIIVDHGGAVHAEQNKPRGAKFVIELPAVKGTQ